MRGYLAAGRTWHILALSVIALFFLFLAAQAEPSRMVDAGEILKKIELGQRVEYKNVIVVGNLTPSAFNIHGCKDKITITAPISINDSIIKDSVNLNCTTFLGPILFYNTTFKGPVFLIGSKFYQDASFRKAKFDNTTWFSDAQFNQAADYRGAEFNEATYFERTLFDQRASFSEALFNQRADFIGSHFDEVAFQVVQFNQPVYFSYAQFSKYATFDDILFGQTADFRVAQFSEAAFRRAQFNQPVYFSKANFSKTVSFVDAEFNGTAYFPEVRFCQSAVLKSVKFNGESKFQKAQFFGNADFSDTEFYNTANFQFAQFNNTKFLRAQFNKDANFDYALFNQTANFNSAKFKQESYFKGTRFILDAVFNDGQFSEEATFDSAEIKTLSLKGAEIENLDIRWSPTIDLAYDESAYYLLRNNLNARGYLDDASECEYSYRCEHRKDLWMKGDFDRWFIDLLAWGSYGYGLRPIRPLIWSLCFILIGGLFFFQTKSVIKSKESDKLSDSMRSDVTGKEGKQEGSVSIWESLLLSATYFTSGASSIISAAHTEIVPVGRGRYVVVLLRLLGWIFFVIFLSSLTKVV